MEVGGIEPPSKNFSHTVTTCLVHVWFNFSFFMNKKNRSDSKVWFHGLTLRTQPNHSPAVLTSRLRSRCPKVRRTALRQPLRNRCRLQCSTGFTRPGRNLGMQHIWSLFLSNPDHPRANHIVICILKPWALIVRQTLAYGSWWFIHHLLFSK